MFNSLEVEYLATNLGLIKSGERIVLTLKALLAMHCNVFSTGDHRREAAELTQKSKQIRKPKLQIDPN